MFRPDSPIKPLPKDVNCVLMNGGVGDHIGGSLVAIKYILDTYPWVKLKIWVPDFLLDFARNVLPKGTYIKNYTAMKTAYDPNITTINTAWDGRVSPMKMHQVDYAFHVLCDEVPSLEAKECLKVDFSKVNVKHFRLPKPYAVLATGYTAGVREFHPDSVNGVVDYLLSKGVTPVFLGQTRTATGAAHVIEGTFKDTIDYSKGINLIDKTSLLQAAAIMQQAKVMLGVDCGLIHVAACTDVPIVAGYTTVSPELRGPTRSGIFGHNWYPVIPDEDLGCRYCQVRTNFLYGHDYKNCMYKDYKCVSQLTTAKFIKELEKIL